MLDAMKMAWLLSSNPGCRVRLSFWFGAAVHSLHGETKVLPDVPGKSVVDLSVSRDRLLLSGRRVEVDVVICSMAAQNATCLDELADQLRSLHTTISLV